MTIYDENGGVPVLFRGENQPIGLSHESHLAVVDAHETAQAAIENQGTAAYDQHYLTGHSVVVQIPNGAGNDFPDGAGEARVNISVGAETLDEALKSIIASVDLAHIHPRNESSDHLHTPTWVASTHAQLGELLADYYSCELRDLSEVI
jgi:hypothetical protein